MRLHTVMLCASRPNNNYVFRVNQPYLDKNSDHIVLWAFGLFFFRGLFDKLVELCNKSVHFEYFFLKFGHVIYLPDVSMLFEFQLAYSLIFKYWLPY